MKCTQCQRRRSSSPSSDAFGSTGVKSVKDRHHLSRETDLIHHNQRKGSEHKSYSLIPSNQWSNTSPSPPVMARDSISNNHPSSGDNNHLNPTLFSPSDSFFNDRNHSVQQTGQEKVTPKSRSDQQQMFMNFKTKSLPPPPPSSGKDISSASSVQKKWSCPFCTFENWPRAIKCSMCYTVKPNTSSSRQDTLLLVDSLEKMSVEDCQEKAEASGGFLIDSSPTAVSGVISTETKSGFTSDSETEDVDAMISSQNRRKDCNTSMK